MKDNGRFRLARDNDDRDDVPFKTSGESEYFLRNKLQTLIEGSADAVPFKR